MSKICVPHFYNSFSVFFCYFTSIFLVIVKSLKLLKCVSPISNLLPETINDVNDLSNLLPRIHCQKKTTIVTACFMRMQCESYALKNKILFILLYRSFRTLKEQLGEYRIRSDSSRLSYLHKTWRKMTHSKTKTSKYI